jgi:hypothetical protein
MSQSLLPNSQIGNKYYNGMQRSSNVWLIYYILTLFNNDFFIKLIKEMLILKY